MSRTKDKISIDSLYFGVMEPSFDGKPSVLTPVNLFDIGRVKYSVARWVTMKPEERAGLYSLIGFCFGDTWGRCEYEFVACPWPYLDDAKVEDCGEKIDIFTAYVKPNEALLTEMVNSVSESSAKKYLSEWRKKYKRC